jgi:acetyl esterase/lipase
MSLIREGVFLSTMLTVAMPVQAAEPSAIVNIWPDQPPGAARVIGPEENLTKIDDRLIAGEKIIKLGNVARPQLHVFIPPEEKRRRTGVVICPGGGFNILAWDLEGTEVARWLNEQGVTAMVLKYRVPRRAENPSLMAVQDTQRALSLARSHAKEWGFAPHRLGVLGFSAGGFAASHVAVVNDKRSYEAVDEIDKVTFRPDFGVIIYAGGLIDDKTGQLKPEFADVERSPALFLVHTVDDDVSCENSIQLFRALKRASKPGELHIWDAGGHGYGLRPDPKYPVTTWPKRCEEWLDRNGWLSDK